MRPATLRTFGTASPALTAIAATAAPLPRLAIGTIASATISLTALAAAMTMTTLRRGLHPEEPVRYQPNDQVSPVNDMANNRIVA